MNDQVQFGLSRIGQAMIARIAGFETPLRAHDYGFAVKEMNKLYDIGLDQTDQELLGLLMKSLARTGRYGGDPSVENGLKENTAIHSLQSVNDIRRVFEKATILEQGAEPLLYAPDQHEVFQLSAKAMIIHDCGELLGEFDTAYQKAHNLNPVDKHGMERLILKRSLMMAMEALEHGDPESFTLKNAGLREEAKIQDKESGEPLGQSVKLAHIKKIFGGKEPQISEEGKARVAKWLEIWDMVEDKDLPKKPEYTPQFTDPDQRAFYRTFVKTIEHNQGNRHRARFGAQDKRLAESGLSDATETVEDTTQKRTLYYIRHVEKDLPELFDSAKTPVESALARATAAFAYESNREFFRYNNPAVFHVVRDREGAPLPPIREDAEHVELPEGLPQDMEYMQKQAALEARAVADGLYKQAEHLVMMGKFTPPPIEDRPHDDGRTSIDSDRIVTLLEHYLAGNKAVEAIYAVPRRPLREIGEGFAAREEARTAEAMHGSKTR